MQELELEQALADLDRHLQRTWKSIVKSSDLDKLSFHECDYLQTIHRLGKPKLSEIARHMEVSKPSASTMISRLEQRGLITRSTSPDDGRVTLIALSRKGSSLISYEVAVYKSLADEVRELLGEQDCQELKRLLKIILEIN